MKRGKKEPTWYEQMPDGTVWICTMGLAGKISVQVNDPLRAIRSQSPILKWTAIPQELPIS